MMKIRFLVRLINSLQIAHLDSSWESTGHRSRKFLGSKKSGRSIRKTLTKYKSMATLPDEQGDANMHMSTLELPRYINYHGNTSVVLGSFRVLGLEYRRGEHKGPNPERQKEHAEFRDVACPRS